MPEQSIEQIIREDGRYPPEAYAFLHEALQRAIRQVHGETGPKQPRHVTGGQICQAVRDLAIQRWGMLARTVLVKWNVRGTIDFGNMVYLMIRHGHWHKEEEDRIEHFRDVFDFAEAFDACDEFEVAE